MADDHDHAGQVAAYGECITCAAGDRTAPADHPGPMFDGPTYCPGDQRRLVGQLARVREVLLDGDWHTLPELAAAVHAPEASVSARVRDLRKERFGGHVVEHERVPGHPSLWRYRLRS